MAVFEVNYLAVLLAAVASMLLAWAWYAPPLLGRMWMEANRKTEADIKAVPKGRTYGLALLSSFLQAWVLAQFLGNLAVGTIPGAALVGAWAWLGFSGNSLATEYLFASRPLKLFLINAGYRLADLCIAGTILAGFR